MRIRITKAAGGISILLGVLDWIGRIDVIQSLSRWSNGLLPDSPWLLASLFVFGGLLILLGWKIPGEFYVTILPLHAVILCGLMFVAACGWFYLDWRKGPIMWTFGDGPHPIYGMQGNDGAPPLVWQMQFTGENRTGEPITQIDGNIRSHRTNREIPLYFQVEGKFIRANATNGVPPNSKFMLIAPITGVTPDTARASAMRSDLFIAEYGEITLNVTFSGRGSPFTRRFRLDELSRPLDEFRNSLLRPIIPTITPKD